jgi:hypothetical protein
MFGGRMVADAAKEDYRELALPDNLGAHLVEEPRASV